MNPFRRPSEPHKEVPSKLNDIRPPEPEPLPEMTPVLSTLAAVDRWLQEHSHLPGCDVKVDADGQVELTWHQANARTARAVVSGLPGHWQVKTAGFVYLSTHVEIPAELSIVERTIECTIFPADDADITSLFTVSA